MERPLLRNLTDEDVLRYAFNGVRGGRRVALCVIVRKEGSGPRDVGAKIVVYDDGRVFGTLGGGSFEKHVVQEALKAITDGRPRLLKYSFVGRPIEGAVDTGLICGGMLTVYIDVLKPSITTFVFGTGRVGKPLADMLNFLGFKVVVADPNPDLVSRDIFPYSLRRLSGDIERVAREIGSMVREGDVVFVTHGEPEADYVVTREALGSKALYVGLLGSRRKVIEFIKRLINDGVPRDVLVKRLRAPVGIDIGAETPEEIAMSIAAELVAMLRGVEVRGLSIVKDYLSGKTLS